MSKQTHPLSLIDRQCGQPAYHVSRMLVDGEPIIPSIAKVFETLDGREVQPMDVVRCGSCGRFFSFSEAWTVNPSSYVERKESA